nr:PREDICTED: uncharacterized protein LOC109037908 isoform X2 [Bemisia tabaci]XP_018908313.1 PREDICTED: uncharacterized protein LOC109037908 isoform X2 [Bemisia tabaci]
MTEIYSVLITGASRGIGLEFVRQFLSESSVQCRIIVAACRSPENANALQELKNSSSKIHILKLDVNQFETFDHFATEVAEIVGNKGLTLLINNAGVATSVSNKLADITPEKFISVLTTNSVAPVLVTKALYPLLKQAAQVQSKNIDGFSVKRAAVINISSVAGSISRNIGNYKCWCYRESKAALNMSTKSLAIELGKDGILVESFHPGFVDTDMTSSIKEGGQHQKISAFDSVKGMITVMLRLSEKNKEGFYDYNGEIITF